MPAKRRAAKARAHRVTPEALAAYAAGDHLRLHRALGLKPWQPSPIDVDNHPPPDWHDPHAWAYALALRREIEATARV